MAKFSNRVITLVIPRALTCIGEETIVNFVFWSADTLLFSVAFYFPQKRQLSNNLARRR